MLLRLLCALGDIDQDTLAVRAGISATTLWRYRTGEIQPRTTTLDRLTAAVGLRWAYVRGSILPSLRAWRLATARVQTDGPGREIPSILDLAGELGERVRTRVGAELGGTAWGESAPDRDGPQPSDRADADFLASCLAGASPDEIALLLRESPGLRSWALAELLCHRSEEPGLEPGRAVELALLANRIAREVAGPESWQARVQAYSEAFLSRALGEAGDTKGSALAAATAETRWQQGTDPQGLLSEERFRTSAGARSA